ncbi:hypothetical protein D3C80_429230 [compost metagenome]
MTDRESGSAARESAVGDQRTGFAQAHRLQEGRWVKHFLHARSAFWPFVANHDHVARHHFSAQNRFDGIVLAFVHFRRAGKFQDAIIDACGFNDTAVFGKVTVQNRQAAFLAVSMLQRANAAFGAVIIQSIPTAVLRECFGGTNSGRARAEHAFHRIVFGEHDVVLLKRLRQRQPENVFHFTVQQPGTIQLTQNPQNATGTVNVFHVIFWRAWCDFTQLRHFARELVDITHGEVDFGFLGRRQQVQNGIG